MNKLVLALAAVATFGLSTVAFAQNPAASTPTAPKQERVQSAPSQAPGAHKMRTSHRTGAKKAVVVRHRTLHHKVSHAGTTAMTPARRWSANICPPNCSSNIFPKRGSGSSTRTVYMSFLT